MIEFREIFFAAGGEKILEKINFRILPGEIVAILGESGAGKSTIFKLLIAENFATSGKIFFDNFSFENLSQQNLQKLRRQIGVVFQNFRLLPKKTIFENVAFALEICGRENLIKKKVPEILSFVGLEKKKNFFPQNLSGGQQQRAAIARALAADPPILLADEPTGNLDPRNSAEIARLFRKINREKNTTIIFATHDFSIVSALQPRILQLKNKKIFFDGEFQNFKFENFF